MFKDNLIKLRNKFDFTQEELAEKMQVSRSVIAKWESGRGLPKTRNLIELSKYFGISIEQLLQ